jgi:hypothetical protein
VFRFSVTSQQGLGSQSRTANPIDFLVLAMYRETETAAFFYFGFKFENIKIKL